MLPKKCPFCKADFDGGSILETFIKQREEGVESWKGMTNTQIEEKMKECYTSPYRWSRVIGIEDPSIYDGISYYRCPDCDKMWKREFSK